MDMKRLIISVLALLPIVLHAQSFWSIVDDESCHNKSHITDVALFQDSMILVSGFVSDVSCSGQNLFAYNFSGQKLWSRYSVSDLIVTDKDNIYTTGYTIATDDIVGDEKLVLSKYNKEGTEIFRLNYSEKTSNYSYFGFYPTGINITDDGKILVCSKTSVVKSDINGSGIKKYDFGSNMDITGINPINPRFYLINTPERIYKSDSSFVLSDSIAFSGNIVKAFLKKDTIYTLLSSCLVRLDTSLNIIDTVISSTLGFQNIETFDNTFWLQLKQAESIKIIKTNDFKSIDTLTFPLLANDIRFIAAGKNYVFAGNSFTNQIGIYHFHADTFASEDYTLPDIELVDFKVDSICIDYVKYLGDSFPRGYYFNAEFDIKNNGNDTIKGLSIFSQLHGGMNCAQNYYYGKYQNLNILPGQTQTVKIHHKYEDGLNNNKLCFQCLAPNSKLETNVNNNSLCKTIDITGVENVKQSKFKVFPNPMANYLMIENWDLKINHVEIIDIDGKTCISKAVSGGLVKIETFNVKPGLYLLKLKSTNKVYSQLVVKE